MAECKSCGAEIKWIKTVRGEYMPCDPKKITIVTMNTGRVIQGYIPHWAICPNAVSHKKEKRRQMMEKPKIFAFINSETSGFLHVVSLAEDGNCLSGHVSSNVSFAKHDIGLTSDWKHENYDRHYPDGWELVWIDDPTKEIKSNKKLKLAVERNEELGNINTDKGGR